MAALTDSIPTNNGNADPGGLPPQPIDQNTNKFLLYGITYLLATPSHFSRAIARDGDQTMRDFLAKAEIKDKPTQDSAIAFTQSITKDPALTMALETLHDALQSDFGGLNYAPTPCPTENDSLKILTAMNDLR